MKKFLFIVTVFLTLLTNQSYSKNLPPGSGKSVPANILILLDRTFSMNWPSERYGGVYKMKEPMAVVQDSTHGFYWVAELDNNGITTWDSDPSPTVNQKSPYGNLSKAGNTACRTSHPWGNNNNKGWRKDNAVNIEEYGGMLYTAHLRNDDHNYGRIKQFNPRVSERLDTSRNTKDRFCVQEVKDQDFHSNHIAIDIQDGIYYAMGGGKWGRGNAYLWVKDLTADTNFGSAPLPCATNFSTGNKWRIDGTGDLHEAAKFVTAITADSNNEYLYVASRYTKKIWSFKITNNCVSETKTAVFDNPCGTSYGLVTDPNDATHLYSVGTYTHKVCKIKVSNGNLVSLIKSEGIADAFEPSSADKLYFMEPHSIKFNQAGNLLVANRGRLEIVIINKDLEFQKVFGLSGVSKLRGAIEAIKAAVSDSALTEGAHFGLGLWSHASGAGYTGWNAGARSGEGQSIPCDTKNCIPVKVDADGARKIYQYLQQPISLYRATHATAFSKMAKAYFNHADSPDDNIDCQLNYVIVIGDGGWKDTTHGPAKGHMRTLAANGVKSIMIAYGNEISGGALGKFNDMASVGDSGYTNAIVATTAQDLKTQLQVLISTITSENLSYTSPAIAGSIESSGKVYQAQFDYFAKKEWEGKLKRSEIIKNNSGISVNTTPDWEASAKLKNKRPSERKIWTAIDGLPYTNYDNFKDANVSSIQTKLFQLTGNIIKDYHNDSTDINGTGRCGANGDNIASVEDGVLDDAKGLINFIRGEDYFGYNGCNLTAKRDHYLADIFNSNLLLVGPPEGEVSYLNENQEAFFRNKNNYQKDFKDVWKDRRKVVYVGANNGILHAFDADTGEEIWGFVPPLIAGRLPTMINPGLNKSSGGGTVPIYGVDGSPVVHDMYFKKPGTIAKAWYSILMIPYGRGGAGFSVLDVTNPDQPDHLYSILNDPVGGKIYRSDHNGIIYKYNYESNSFNNNNVEEIAKVNTNYAANSSVSSTCNNAGNTSCYKGKKITINDVPDIEASSDVKIYIDGEDVSGSSTWSKVTGSTTLVVTLGKDVSYSADPNSGVINSTVNVTIVNGMPTAGLEYDYRYLAETWSSPRVFRLPNSGAGDSLHDDDIYAAVMGGGYGVNVPGLGSNVLVVNLENGKLIRQIDIPDLRLNNIANSVPATPVVITPDLSLAANFKGALVYINDLEGKITKINLTNMKDDRAQSGAPAQVSLYDTTTLFSANSTADNNRYMYHSMDATIGGTTNDLWLYAGTGDYLNLNDSGITNPGNVDNLLIGIKDESYPNFKALSTLAIDDLTKCKNTTNDISGANCPGNAHIGWYIKLEPDSVVERRKVTAEPTVDGGYVYFPVFKPASSDKCALGDAYICAADDECGTNSSQLLGTNPTPHSLEKCLHVGQGALTKIVAHGGTLFSGIAGESTKGNKDLVILPGIGSNLDSYRIDWREND